MKNIFILCCAALAYSACCTKADCNLTVVPSITVIAEGFDETTLKQSKLYRFIQPQYIAADSSDAYDIYSGSFYPIYPYQAEQSWYVLKTGNRSDTIDNISVDIVTRKVKCNSCFPPGVRQENVLQTTYENLRFDLNGVTHNGQTVHIKP